MGEPPKETGTTVTRGHLFTQKVNDLLRAQPDNEEYLLAMNEEIYGPIFDKTIEELHRTGKDMHAHTIFTATVLRLYDELKAKKEKYPSQYFVEENTTLEHISEISGNLLKHPEAKNGFVKIEALKHLPIKGTDF